MAEHHHHGSTHHASAQRSRSGSILRIGSHGPEVAELKALLKRRLYRIRSTGNDFDGETDTAVRSFQRHNGLLPDGIAGPKTLQMLQEEAEADGGDQQGANRGRRSDRSHQGRHDVSRRVHGADSDLRLAAAYDAHGRATPPGGLSTSSYGLQFIYRHEAMRGVSCHLHWPRGASGVTLGPGYDMKERSRGQIRKDLLTLGLSADAASRIAEASGRTGSDAERFCRDNRSAVTLSPAQEMALLRQIVRPYEATVRRMVKVHLVQHEFDALVCFAYNPGGRLARVTSLINAGQVAVAMAEIKKAVTSKGEVMQGLVNRRNDEVRLYIAGR